MDNFITGMRQGVEAGNEMIYGGERDKAQNELLSAQAQTAQLNLQAKKTEATNTLAAQAGLAKVAHDNANTEFQTNEGQLKKYDMAISAMGSNPAAQEQLRKERDNLELKQTELASKKESLRQLTQEKIASRVSEALNFSDPMTAANEIDKIGSESGDPHLGSLAKVLRGEIEIPQLGGKWQDADQTKKDTFINKMVRPALMPARDKAFEAANTAQYQQGRVEALQTAADAKALAAERVAAATRDKTKSEEEINSLKRDKIKSDAILRYERLIQTYAKDEGETVANPDYKAHWISADEGTPTIPNPRIVALRAKIDKLESEDTTPDTSKKKDTGPAKGTKENPIKL